MSVELDPPELGFKRPFTHEVSQVLRLHNPSNDSIAFKVKTTAPKQYCVRPNSGKIDPGKDAEVQVLLQAMKEDPPPDARCRDKFLVQSVAVSADTATGNVAQVWSNIEQSAKSSIQERKIKVNFLPADSTHLSTPANTQATSSSGLASSTMAAAGLGAATAGAGAAAATTNGVRHNEDAPPAYTSPSPSAATPQRYSNTMSEKDIDDSTYSNTQESSTVAATAASVGIPTSQAELQEQLDRAKAEIARLQEQASEGIRQRKPQEAVEKTINSVQQSMQNAPAPGGVPLPIVAGLCLLCFILAWLFF